MLGSRENNPLLHRNLRGLVIGKSGRGKTTATFNLLLQADCLDYNHVYVFGKSLHQQEYKVLRKGLDAGLSKHQISNLFSSQGALHTANIYLLLQPLKHLVVNVMERYHHHLSVLALMEKLKRRRRRTFL